MKKKRTITPPDLMERTRATVALVNGTGRGSRDDLGMYAFLSLFHPEMSDAKKRELSRKEQP